MDGRIATLIPASSGHVLRPGYGEADAVQYGGEGRAGLNRESVITII